MNGSDGLMSVGVSLAGTDYVLSLAGGDSRKTLMLKKSLNCTLESG